MRQTHPWSGHTAVSLISMTIIGVSSFITHTSQPLDRQSSTNQAAYPTPRPPLVNTMCKKAKAIYWCPSCRQNHNVDSEVFVFTEEHKPRCSTVTVEGTATVEECCLECKDKMRAEAESATGRDKQEGLEC